VKRILFVDDEAAVLEGLRDRLRKQRREWDMVFALGGDAALTECARKPFDVVVSDMRMPGMDGATLLRRIQELYPSTVRVVLSGHAEREAVMRVLPVAHQYLSKPCDADTLRSVIARACALQALLMDEALRSIVGRVERLPSVSNVYAELTAVLAREAPSADDVVRVVERDPAMCLKLLQVVNSAFFGLPRKVSAMRDAITYLGIELLKSLVLASQIFSVAEDVGIDAGWLAEIQGHSVHVGRVARNILPAQSDDAFMTGMLHDVGKILLALADRVLALKVVTLAREQSRPDYLVERELFGITHAEAGAYILGTWGAPAAIVEAVAGHHEPSRFGGSSLDLGTAVHAAESLVTEAAAGEGHCPLDVEHLARLGVSDRIEAWRLLVAQERKEGA
jgi:HD-like signal output (HDOD) protein